MSGHLPKYASPGNSYLRMGYLIIIIGYLIRTTLIQIILMPVEETLQTPLPSNESIRQILGNSGRRKLKQRQEQYQRQHQDTRQLRQLTKWQLTDKHHQETNPE